MNVNPYESPDTPSEDPVPAPLVRRFRLIELLVVLGVVGLIVALLLPAQRGSRESSRRFSCRNNLKQIMLALHNYEDEHGELPPAYTVDDDGKPLHSWRTLILPYLEQKPLYDQIDLSKPWDDPANKVAYETEIGVYQCPSAAIAKTHTTYLAAAGERCFLHPTKPRKLGDITDGTSNTIAVMEVDAKQAVHWMAPRDADEHLLLNFGKAEKLSHPGGAQAALADGSTRFISAETKLEILHALLTIAGGEEVELD